MDGRGRGRQRESLHERDPDPFGSGGDRLEELDASRPRRGGPEAEPMDAPRGGSEADQGPAGRQPRALGVSRMVAPVERRAGVGERMDPGRVAPGRFAASGARDRGRSALRVPPRGGSRRGRAAPLPGRSRGRGSERRGGLARGLADASGRTAFRLGRRTRGVGQDRSRVGARASFVGRPPLARERGERASALGPLPQIPKHLALGRPFPRAAPARGRAGPRLVRPLPRGQGRGRGLDAEAPR